MASSVIASQLPISYAQAMAPIIEQIDASTTTAFGNLTSGLPSVTQMSQGAYNFAATANTQAISTAANVGNTGMGLVNQNVQSSTQLQSQLGNQAVGNYQILANKSGGKKK